VRRLLLALCLPLLVRFTACAPDCQGILVNGQCQQVCQDELCPAGDRCVNNACRAACSSTSPCPAGQKCEALVSDYGTSGSFCAGPSSTGSDGAPCSSSKGCAESSGYRCIAGSGACAFTCNVHADCGSRGSCTGIATDTEGKAVHTCAPDSFPRGPGQYGTSCAVNGATDCDTKNGFVCIGTGAGDIDAYCSKKNCTADGDCPSGSFCATSDSPDPPCEAQCGLNGKSQLANCIPSSDIGDGKPYRCGPVSLLFNVCRHREFCNSCTTDADCLGKPNQVCADDGSGEKICTVLCDPDIGTCPWGSASRCGVWDQKLGVATCAHRFGSCHGTGKSCEPCVQQSDCPSGYCTEAKFSGERYCVDLSVSCACPAGTTSSCSGGGCPLTPGGLPMTCEGGSDNEGSPLFDKCIGANANVGERATNEGCWPK